MEKTVLRKLQLAELEMLKDVAKFCDENNIEYFLAEGTLLGALRHSGFIPWDDDIDIGMDYRNFKKFLRLSKKGLPEKYFVQHFSTDPKVAFPWIKVRINGTTSMEPYLRGYDIHYGICMDIFLFNGISKKKFRKALQQKLSLKQRNLLMKYYYIEGDVPNLNGRRVRMLPEFLRRLLIRIYDRIINLDSSKTEYCYDTYYVEGEKSYTYKTAWFNTKDTVSFEKCMFFSPGEAEAYLTTRYGDWETPPPENEREAHGDIIVDFENDYTVYRNNQK